MKEHPILFTAEMVRAILDGRKTQTRRIVKAKPPKYFNVTNIGWLENTKLLKKRRELVKVYSPGWYWIDNDAPCGAISGPFKCPYGKPGDLLWVRETWNNDWCNHPIYKADGGSAKEVGYASEPKWKSPRYMPKKVARIWLKVTDIRVERVQEISGEDAWKEGIDEEEALSLPCSYAAEAVFSRLWEEINAKRGYPWESNPWVWVIEFKVKTK